MSPSPPQSVDANDVRSRWATRSGEYSPAYYAHYGPDETSEFVRSSVDAHCGPAASVLEVGCGVGRHLSALAAAGYTDLTGVDVNAQALSLLRETYPTLAGVGSFHATPIEEYVTDVPDDAVDAVFSVETLQHIPPETTWVFDDIARVAGDLVVTVENERGEYGTVNYVDDGLPLYYRDWHRVFTDRGFVEVTTVEQKRDTARVFRAE